MNRVDRHPLLEIERLSVGFRSGEGLHPILAGIDLTLYSGEMLALQGASGCGKTTLALTILRLLPGTAEARGVIRFKGADLLRVSEKRMRGFRGRDISMVLQEPRAALDPLLTAGRQIGESLKVHFSLSGEQARRRATELLQEVGFREPDAVLPRYPHQLSIGECQRVLLAASLAAEPALLICDEPTSALDGPHRLRILTLLDQLRERHKLAILLISQDLRLVQQFCDRHVTLVRAHGEGGPSQLMESIRC